MRSMLRDISWRVDSTHDAVDRNIAVDKVGVIPSGSNKGAVNNITIASDVVDDVPHEREPKGAQGNQRTELKTKETQTFWPSLARGNPWEPRGTKGPKRGDPDIKSTVKEKRTIDGYDSKPFEWVGEH